jgi:anti-sigma B factor antagonist
MEVDNTPEASRQGDDDGFARKHLTLVIEESDPSLSLLVVSLKGELDIATLALCRHDLSAALNLFGRRPATWIILDLSECTFVDSTGLGVFISVMKIAKRSGGEAVFVGLLPQVRRLFEVTNVTQILTVTDSVKQARRLIAAARKRQGR